MSEQYIVVRQQIYTNEAGGFEIAYDWDGERFPAFAKAKSHGFDLRGTDDFNIASVSGDKLITFQWMDTVMDHESAASAARGLDMEYAPTAGVLAV